MPARPQKAAAFHALHEGFLVLPNAWDAVSAKVVERAGSAAIATSSAAVAWSCGYADGHDLPFARLIAVVEDIARVTSLPISVDAEGGYADDPVQVGDNVRALIAAGAVGINLEDGQEAHDLHLRKIEAAREASDRAGVDLFINARTDVFLKQLTPADRAVDETVRRARAFRDAGASGLFAPLALKSDDIRAIADAAPLPLNVLVWRGLPDAATLKRLGVRRLSAGAGLARAALAAAQEACVAFLATGDSDVVIGRDVEAINYNALIKG